MVDENYRAATPTTEGEGDNSANSFNLQNNKLEELKDALSEEIDIEKLRKIEELTDAMGTLKNTFLKLQAGAESQELIGEYDVARDRVIKMYEDLNHEDYYANNEDIEMLKNNITKNAEKWARDVYNWEQE